tara:strand:+ start:1630 stop:2958 length:1329 start_codon:yes stop_codon:yes gene_type:complete
MGVWDKIKGGARKLFKGVKKVFNKIGRGISKVVGKVGNFMGKAGWLGTLAMPFILGPALAAAFTSGGFLSSAAGFLGKTFAKPFSWMLNQAGKFVKVGGNAFRTVGEGIGSFIKNMGQAVISKVPGGEKFLNSMNIEATNFSDAWGKVQENIGSNFKGILDPLSVDKGRAVLGKGRSLESISRSTGLSIEDLGKYNQDLVQGVAEENWGSVLTKETQKVFTKDYGLTQDYSLRLDDIDLGVNVDMPVSHNPAAARAAKSIAPTISIEDIPEYDPSAITLPELRAEGRLTSDFKIAPDPVYDPAQLTLPEDPEIFEVTPDFKIAPVGSQGPSLLSPYGEDLRQKLKRPVPSGAAPVRSDTEADARRRASMLREADDYVIPNETLAAGTTDFGGMATTISSTTRNNYDALNKQGALFGNTQSVYDSMMRLNLQNLSAVMPRGLY